MPKMLLINQIPAAFFRGVSKIRQAHISISNPDQSRAPGGPGEAFRDFLMTKPSLISLFFLLFSLYSPSLAPAQDRDIDAKLKSFEKDLWLMERSVKQMENYPRKLDGSLKRQDAQRAKEDRRAGQEVQLQWNKKLKEHDIAVIEFENRAREIERKALQ